MADCICLKLSYDGGAHFAKVKVGHLNVASDDGDEHLPFVRECSQGNHGLELRRDFDICSFHPSEHAKHLIEIDVGVGGGANARSEALLEVPKDCGGHRFSIGTFQSIPERVGGEVGGVVLLNHRQEPEHNLPNHHSIILVPRSLSGENLISPSLREFLPLFLLIREAFPFNIPLNISPHASGHYEGFHRNCPLPIIGSIKDGDQGCGVVGRHSSVREALEHQQNVF